MPDIIPCAPACCTTALPVNVPGAEGIAGDDGEDGINAYSTVTGAGFSTPANVGDTVTGMPVDTSAWMVIGQIIVFDGPATFRVTNIPNGTSVDGVYLDYPGDVGTAQAIAAGATVSASGVQPDLDTESIIATGTVYTPVTNTYAAVNFGTLDPIVTLDADSTYLIFGRARFNYVAATFAAKETVFLKLRRTNPAAGDLTNGEGIGSLDIVAAPLSQPAADIQTPPVIYTTGGVVETLQLYAMVSTVPGAGTLDLVQASIVAVKLS